VHNRIGYLVGVLLVRVTGLADAALELDAVALLDEVRGLGAAV
jgi:hypothetical protein